MPDAMFAGMADLVAMVLLSVVFRLVAADRGWVAGVFAVLSWYASILTTTMAVTTFQHGSLGRSAWFVFWLSLSTLFGTKFGQVIGRRIAHALEGANK